jgi:hypothetical protein
VVAQGRNSHPENCENIKKKPHPSYTDIQSGAGADSFIKKTKAGSGARRPASVGNDVPFSQFSPFSGEQF